MPRLLSPDDACVRVKIPVGDLEATYKGRVIDVDSPSHIKMLRDEGYVLADVSGGSSRASGYRCPKCAFRGFFKVCGRCGGACEKE